jgi:hypothetical protein
MAKKNADLIGQTAETLLTKINGLVAEYDDAGSIKTLAEAFAIVAEHDQPQKSGSAYVM